MFETDNNTDIFHHFKHCDRLQRLEYKTKKESDFINRLDETLAKNTSEFLELINIQLPCISMSDVFKVMINGAIGAKLQQESGKATGHINIWTHNLIDFE